ncbi:unnamed protein product, partial [Candidula unifasciata]
MSFVDEDNGSAEMEENPDPEEDSGLPQRYQLDGEASEEENAEEDLGMVQVTASNDSQNIPNNEDGNVGGLSENAVNIESSTVNTVDWNTENIVVSDLGGSREGNAEQENNVASNLGGSKEGITDQENSIMLDSGDSKEETLEQENSVVSNSGGSKEGIPEQENSVVLDSGDSKEETLEQENSVMLDSGDSKEETLEQENSVVSNSGGSKEGIPEQENSVVSNSGGSKEGIPEQENSVMLDSGDSKERSPEQENSVVSDSGGSKERIPEQENSVVSDSEGSNVENPEQNYITVAQTDANEHFLKECENTLIADCDSDLRCKMRKAVETKLFHDPVPSQNQSNALQTENEISKSQESDSESDLKDISTESFVNNPENTFTDNDGAQLSETMDTLSKGVDRNVSPKDRLDFCTGQGALVEIPQQNSSSINPDELFQVVEADLSAANTESIPCAMNSVMDRHENVASDTQNLECSEQSITDKVIPNSTLTETDEFVADEKTSLVLPDNSLGFPEVTAESIHNTAQEFVLEESVVTRDGCVGLSSPVKAWVSANIEHTSVGEHQNLSVLTHTEHSQTARSQNLQANSNSSLGESCLHNKPTDIILQHNITSGDCPNYTHLTQTESQHSQQNGHLQSDPPSPYDKGNSHTHIFDHSSLDYSSDSSNSSQGVLSYNAAFHLEDFKSSQRHVFESSSEGSSPASSQKASPAKAGLCALTTKFSQGRKEQTSNIQSGLDDELLLDFDAEFQHYISKIGSSQKTSPGKASHLSDSRISGNYRNGLQSAFDVNQIQMYNKELLEQLQIRDKEIAKLTSKLSSLGEIKAEVRSLGEDYQLSPSHQADDLYIPQIKDTSAKRAITTLQHELKSRVEQVTKLYEECRKEKDMIVVRFAESEAKHIDARRIVEKSEAKVKEAMKERDLMMNALKAAKADKQKALTNFEMKCIEVSNVLKEVEKLKEAVNSSDHRVKWFQNKLKEELESHKETKSNLEKITAKLKEAREETELIRKECQAIVKRYQESDEFKSNSLDKELKLKETELKTQIQELSDTEEVHQMLKRELDSLKAQHKDVIEENKIYKDKVTCLEEERRQNHQMIENYQEIMQRQKTNIAELNIKIASLSVLDEEYQRSQDIIQALQKDIAELQMTNQDLQKDMESCSERESKMLTLQSELSHTSALLRSENTSLSNKILSLTSEVEKHKMEIQTLEASVRNL